MVAVTTWIGMNKLWSVAPPYVGCATVLKELCIELVLLFMSFKSCVSFTHCKHVNVRAPYTMKCLNKISLCLPFSIQGHFSTILCNFY